MSMIEEVKQLIGERDLSGVARKLRESGLDEQVSSWISKGENLPVVGGQIENALGNDVVAGIAAKLGITTSHAADELAQAVPEVVDEMTPDGELP
ncbi:MAG: YidB family protein [Gaiellaceae bacterium]|nr:DUF937 domain-containing protein [Actinomycetota bacterium]